MKPIITLLLIFLSQKTFSQTFKEKELKTDIKEVTVFLNGAQIFEAGSVNIPSGKSILKIKGLSPYLDEKSIQVKAEGDFTILSVNHKFNYLSEIRRDEKSDSLRKIVDAIESAISYENARLSVLKEKQGILNENKNLRGQNEGVSVLLLRQAIEFYESEITKIRNEEISIGKKIQARNKERAKLELQLQELNQEKSNPTSEIEIRVNSEAPINSKFKLTYLVGNAGWYPKYDIRVRDVKSPLELTYKAEVFQNTGVDWKNVKLRFSNGNPNQSGVIPELNIWNLNYARYTSFDKSAIYGSKSETNGIVKGRALSSDDGTALPGVNVVVKGTTIGTVTDAQGNYSLTLPNGANRLVFSFIGLATQEVEINKQSQIDVSLQADVAQLSEVIVTGYGSSGDLQGRTAGVSIRGNNSMRRQKAFSQPIITTVIENQTTVEIEVATPYSINSNGEKLQVDLRKHEIDALYEYYAIPKLDKDAFLIARIINWDQYNLLEGEANLYFEDAYVGRSILDAKSLQDTLNISLGRDKSIVIGRERNEQFSKRRAIGSNISETRGFKITVRNKKSQPIRLTLFDQIPVSVISYITVSPVELTKGLLDEKSGKVTWELTIDPQQQKEINLQYEVKYPKREKIILE